MPPRRPLPEPDLNWTTARCLRILRPISSRIIPLQRLAAEERSRGISDPFSSFSADGEPSWLSLGAKTGKGKKTYAARRRRKLKGRDLDARPAAEREEVEAPTPFRRGGAPATPPEPIAAPAPALKGKAKQAATKRSDLEDAVLLGLKLLLEKTRGSKVPEETTGSGVPSLRDSCLRMVPAYIAAEAAELKRENPDDNTDVVAEVYGELEAFGLLSHDGYSALELVVRAHGLSMVVDMMRQKTIATQSSRDEFVAVMMKAATTTRGEKLAMGCDLFAFQTKGISSLERDGYGADNSLPKMPISVVKHLLESEFGGCITPVEDWTLHEIRRIGRYGDNGELDVIHMALEAACLGQVSNSKFRQLPTLSTGGVSWRSNWQRSIGTLGIMALIGSQAESPDWRYSTGRRIRSTLSALTMAVMRKYQRHADGFKDRSVGKGRAALILKLLLTSLMLQLLVEPFPEEHAEICTLSLIKQLRCWLLETCGGLETALHVTSQVLIEFCRGAGCKDPDATIEWVREVGNQLLSGSRSLEKEKGLPAMLRQIALSFTRRYAQDYSSVETKMIVQDLELAIDQIGGLDHLQSLSAGRVRAHDFPKEDVEWDEGLQEWLFIPPSTSAVDVGTTATADLPRGIAIVQPEALTPGRKKMLMIVASPDELQSGGWSVATGTPNRSSIFEETSSRSSMLEETPSRSIVSEETPSRSSIFGAFFLR